MILQSLVRLAEREGLLGEPGYEPKDVAWLIELDRDGRALGVTYTGEKVDKKERFLRTLVPKRCTRSGLAIRADRLVDKAQYVLGMGDPKTLDEADAHKRLDDCRRAFLESTRQLADASSDEGLVAQARFLSAFATDPTPFLAMWGSDGDVVRAPQGAASIVDVPRRATGNLSALIGFTYLGAPIWRRPAAQAWLAARDGEAADDAGALETCLVTGQECTPVRNHEKVDLPGDTGPLPFISFNASAYEHYDRAGNHNAPVGPYASAAYAMALRRLVGRGGFAHPTSGELMPARSVQLGAKTTALYWADVEGAGDDPTDLLMAALGSASQETDIQHVRAVLEAPRTGRPPLIADPTPFYLLIVTREKSRVVLRTAELHTLGEIARSVVAFLGDLAICPRFADERVPTGLRSLLDATVSIRTSDTEPAPDLAARLMRCALDSRLPYPPELLATVLRRFRSQDDDKQLRFTRRMALLKAVLVRTYKQEIPVSLEPNHPSTAYNLGRLFAVLEKTQQEAIDAKAGIADRFLGTAMASPALVFSRLMKLSHHHLAKIGGGREVNLGRLLDGVVAKLPPELPSVLELRDQGTFMIGYHHQRADLWTKKTDAGTAAKEP